MKTSQLQPLQILIAEDHPLDAELLVRELRRGGFEPISLRVDTEAAYLEGLHRGLDLVISDYEMPEFSGPRALELLKQSGLEIPLIIVSGTIGEDTAVAAMKLGAADYILKDRLARLGPAVGQALTASRLRQQRNQSEAALRLFRTLMDQSSDTLEIIDPATARFVDVSGKGPAELGYTRAEYLFFRLFDIDPSVDEATWPQVVARIRAAGSISGESIHRRKDGTSFPIEFNAKWVHHDRDYIVTLVRDITERKQAETALRNSEMRFRSTLENLIEGCQIVGRDWRYLYVNEIAARHGQKQTSELTGRLMMEVYPGIEASPIFAALRECMERGTARELENEFKYDDGSTAYFQLVVQPVPEGLFILSLDITERKRSERKVESHMAELLRWQEVMLGRENRVQALKAEINALLATANLPPRYEQSPIP